MTDDWLAACPAGAYSYTSTIGEQTDLIFWRVENKES
jgi:hypothetical protein